MQLLPFHNLPAAVSALISASWAEQVWGRGTLITISKIDGVCLTSTTAYPALFPASVRKQDPPTINVFCAPSSGWFSKSGRGFRYFSDSATHSCGVPSRGVTSLSAGLTVVQRSIVSSGADRIE